MFKLLVSYDRGRTYTRARMAELIEDIQRAAADAELPWLIEDYGGNTIASSGQHRDILRYIVNEHEQEERRHRINRYG